MSRSPLLTFQVIGGIQPLIDYIGRIADVDLMPLAMQFRTLAIEDNIRRSEAGQDKADVDLVPLRGGRTLQPAEIRRRGGTGPPLAPRHFDSRIETAYQVEIARLGYYGADKAISIKAGWPGLYWMKYHIEGRGHNPKRDVAGPTPQLTERMADRTRRFMVEKLGLY
jgi:hypothetical protein